MIPNPILSKHLRGACKEQRELFESTFPEGMEITEENVEKAFGVGLDVGWAVFRLFPKPLWEEYERRRAPLLAEYERQEAPLWEEYGRWMPLLAEYERQVAPLAAEYERQRAALIARLATSDGA